MALFLLVGDVETDAFGKLGELRAEHLTPDLEDAVSADAGHDPAEDEQIADLVEIGVGRDGVPEINADGFVDLHGARVARGGKLLDALELDWKRHIRRKVDAGGGEQAAYGLLRKILGSDAAISGPLVHVGALLVIVGDEGELVEPARDRALRRDV